MIAIAKRGLKSLLATPAGWRASASVRPAGAAVLMYHRVNREPGPFPGLPVARFREQMQWIARNCTPVAADEIPIAAAPSRRARPLVAVTFDDGYRDYHDIAWPILRELGIPATVFLSTAFMDEGGLIWTEQVEWAVATTNRLVAPCPWRPQGSVASLGTAEGKRAFVREAKHHLKGAPERERQEHLRAVLRALAAPPVEKLRGRQMLSWDEVRATREGTRFGGHTHTHPILSQLDPAAMEREIAQCRERIAGETGEAPRMFAYPNGRACDFNAATQAALRRQGFDRAFTTEPGLVRRGADPLAIRRQPTGAARPGDFAALVAGA